MHARAAARQLHTAVMCPARTQRPPPRALDTLQSAEVELAQLRCQAVALASANLRQLRQDIAAEALGCAADSLSPADLVQLPGAVADYIKVSGGGLRGRWQVRYQGQE